MAESGRVAEERVTLCSWQQYVFEFLEMVFYDLVKFVPFVI